MSHYNNYLILSSYRNNMFVQDNSRSVHACATVRNTFGIDECGPTDTILSIICWFIYRSINGLYHMCQHITLVVYDIMHYLDPQICEC